MATSIYGFAKHSSPSGGGKSSTLAMKMYRLAIAQATDAQGVISNPDVYAQARDTYLKPYINDVDVQLAYSDSQNDEAKLRNNMNDSGLASSSIQADMQEVLQNYAKQYYNDPQSLVATSAYVYNTAIEKVSAEIDQREAAGDSTGDLKALRDQLAPKAENLTRLTQQLMATGKPVNPDAYGIYMRTNPDDGSIISIDVAGSNDSTQKGDFTRTETVYGGIPVWVNTTTDAEGNKSARIGTNAFKQKVVTVKDPVTGKDKTKLSETLDRVGTEYKGFFRPSAKKKQKMDAAENKDLFPLNEDQKTVDISGVKFGNALNLPPGSITRDAAGNYYYYGKDGQYKAESKDILQQYLQETGQPVDDVDKVAFPISRGQAQAYGPFTNEDGTSRVIDKNMLGGASLSSQDQSTLPPMDQSAKSTFQSSPAPTAAPSNQSSMAPVTQSPASDASRMSFEVPRKTPGIKQASQVGTQTTADTIDNVQHSLTNAAKSLGRKFFG